MRNWGALKGLGLSLICLSAVSADAASDEDRISPDRPDFTEGTDIVKRGRIQLETGFTRARRGNAWSSSLSETLLRYAVSPRHELRIELPTFTWERHEQEIEHGMVGLKWALPHREKDPVELALIASASVPSGNTGKAWQPQLLLAAEHEITESMSLGGGIGWEREFEEGVRTSRWFGSLALESRLNDRMDGYIEWFGLFGQSHGEKNRNLVNSGLIYYINKDLAFDVSAGYWLDGSRKNYYFGVGLSCRW